MSIEGIPNPLEGEKNINIENARSFDDLYAEIKTLGEIGGTSKDYSPERMIKIIERVRHGHRPIEFVTRSYGIRAAVARLLENDDVYRKYTEGSKAKKM
ncbi:MAG: hypothetical protein V1846_03710 [Candidatus Komeilibacteria bacterium]